MNEKKNIRSFALVAEKKKKFRRSATPAPTKKVSVAAAPRLKKKVRSRRGVGDEKVFASTADEKKKKKVPIKKFDFTANDSTFFFWSAEDGEQN
jgi:hypothetical protein